ncbi:Hypothetical protein, putative [Bodo saltans]|uniref:SET domain-containing protein n=1 Tax=Bodo saltans TaxID=75058 RepID=A0A0S4JQY2_BODSA|nr:Hypothetical protein, putative [Bodo saltans]|eukprot:CUG93937.1 Hypothetical protein, putative [Bodo saltans]
MAITDVVAAIKEQLPHVVHSIEEFFTAASKSSALNDEVADKWKQKGNEDFTKGDADVAAIHYTKGMTFAKSDDVLAVLLNNRATVFYQQKRLREALMDSHAAIQLKADYWKARKRRAACLKELGFASLAEREENSSANEDMTAVVNETDEELLRALARPFSGPFTPPPSSIISQNMQIQRDAKGRFISATSRMEPQTLVLETPFAVAPRGEGLFTACSLCMHRTSALFPSAHYRSVNAKSRGLFCSTQCADAQWSLYGERESKHPFYLLCSVDTLLALRIVASSFRSGNVKRVESVVERHTAVLSSSTAGDPEAPEAAATAASLPFDPVMPKNSFGRAHVDLMVGAFSRELVPFAEVGGKETLISAVAMLAGSDVVADAQAAERLRKALRQVLLNAVHISCVDRVISTSESHSFVTVTVGKALYSVGSLFNHSCDPNCHLSFQGNPHASSARLCIRLIRPVMEGEELTVSYGNIEKTKVHSTRGRIRTLRANYGFACTCNECRNAVDECIRKEDEAHYVKAADYYQKGRRLVREGNFTDAVTVLLQSYEIVMKFICPPPRPPQMMLPKTHDALAQAYLLQGDQAKCVEHLKASLDLNIQLHGGEYVDLVREYTRFALLSHDSEYRDKALALLETYYAPSEFLEAEKLYLTNTFKSSSSAAAA